LIDSFHRLIECVDRPSVLFRLAIAFIAAWAIFLSQVSTLDRVPSDYIDKGVSLSFSRGVSFDNLLRRWERFYAEFGSLLLPVVAATLAYWQFDLRKSVSLQSSETVR